MTFVLDSGALVALERNERPMWVRLKAALVDGEAPVTHGGVIGQVWREGPRQARLAKALESIDVRSLDAGLGRAAGQLLSKIATADVIDASLVLLAVDGDVIITDDSGDIEPLAAAAGVHVEVLHP